MKTKKSMIKLFSILIYLFSIFIHIYDMINHDRLRVLCRTIGSSKMLAISWIFIVMTIIIIVYQNENFNYKILCLIFLCYIMLTIAATLDYKNRLKKKNNWKKIHYFLSVIMLFSLVYGVYNIRSEYSPIIIFLFILFLIFHTSKDYIINDKISVIYELLIIYASNFLLLLKTNQNLEKNYI